MAGKRAVAVVGSVAAIAALLFGLSFVRRTDHPRQVVDGKAPAVKLHFYRRPGVLLHPGDTITSSDAVAVSYQNFGIEALWALIFAYDSRGRLYWLEPHHVQGMPGQDLSVPLWASPKEMNVGSAARFGELPPGPFDVFVLVTADLIAVSRIERLEPQERNRPSLENRFADGVVAELPLLVAGPDGG